MSSPSKDMEEPTSSTDGGGEAAAAPGEAAVRAASPRPPAKRRISSTVIEISDTESDDSDVCAVTSYQASADEVKRIRGADYSSTSSSSDYSSDSESPWEDDSVVVEDERPLSKIVRVKLNPRASRMDDPKFNPAFKKQELIDRLTLNWKEHKDYSCEEVTLTCEPFRLSLLHDLLANSEIINNIIDDMNTLDWSRKKMDLYEFHQTTDLASLTWQRGIKGIYELLKTEVMSWVSLVTGLELSSVSASCSLYGPGDHLLPHDDLLGDRRVAFILYLAPWRPKPRRPKLENGAADHTDVDEVEECLGGWSSQLGGELQLLARDAQGRPTTVMHSVLPRNNTLAFFQVGPHTYHQVSEVVSLELPRLSINGWFHGPAPDDPAPPSPPPPSPPTDTKPHTHVVLVGQWVNAAYMSPRARAQVQAQMERDSEVCLRGFLAPEALDRLMPALDHQDVPWEWCGPANQRRYERIRPSWADEGGAGAGAGAGVGAGGDEEGAGPARALLRLAGSAAWTRLLADCTDLALKSHKRLEMQRWRAGDYTLLPPREQYQEARLELVLYLGVPERALSGGTTTYVAPEEAPGTSGPPAADEGALVTLPPVHNALNLVYCDAGAAGFTKYLSKMTMRDDDHFYILACTYKE